MSAFSDFKVSLNYLNYSDSIIIILSGSAAQRGLWPPRLLS
jgi:hypothetical protein